MPNTREKLIELLAVTSLEFEEAVTLADFLIANGVTVQEWISVKDRLPEEPDRYLCNVKSFAFKGAYYQTILKYDKGGFIEGHIYTDDVTHWMPLPPAPEV